jgi:hypothetical protein
VQEDVLEGKFIGEAQTHHDHTGNPEENDVATSFQKITWEESLEVGVLNIGPSKGGEGEQT